MPKAQAALPLLTWDEVLAPGGPWAYFVSGDERHLESHVWSENGHHPEHATRILRGLRCQTAESLFQEWAAAFQFPYYFGNNWNAFFECITDLEWLPSKGYIAVVAHLEETLREQPQDMRILLGLLKDAPRWLVEYRKSSIPFRVVFHCEAANRDTCLALLADHDVNPVERRLRFFSTPDEPESYLI